MPKNILRENMRQKKHVPKKHPIRKTTGNTARQRKKTESGKRLTAAMIDEDEDENSEDKDDED